MLFRYSVSHHLGAAILFLLVCAISGCGKNSGAATQVVARVNGEEISVHQVNSALAKSTGVTPENLPSVKREILERLIEQQISINEATSRKLDRMPEVVTAIENAKREIIAKSTFDQIASSQPKPSDEEAKKYFAEHPELFLQRRIFNLQEIALRKGNIDAAQINDMVAVAKTMEEVSTWLKGRSAEFTVNAGTRAAEQIPLEALPRLQQFKDGQLGFIPTNDTFYIMRVITSQSAPVSEAQALQSIKIFLFNRRGAEAIKREMTLMKGKATVEYLGEFASGSNAAREMTPAAAKTSSDAMIKADEKSRADGKALAKIKADEKAALHLEAEALSKARAETRAQSSKDQKPVDPSTNINLEKGMEGLK